jgi:hypothetical protein
VGVGRANCPRLFIAAIIGRPVPGVYTFKMKIPRAIFLILPLGLAACGDPEFGSDFDGDFTGYFAQDLEQIPDNQYVIIGKVLVLDADARQIDATHDFLPDAIKALTPDEVGTIAIITCMTDFVGSYGWFSDGYEVLCHGDLFDAATGKKLGQIDDRASPPGETAFPYGDKIAKKPARGLAQRIADLARLN